MDLDDVLVEVLTEYEVELNKRSFKELIALCFDELENEGEIAEHTLQEFFTDLEVEATSGMISEIIYRIHEKADEDIDDLYDTNDAGDREEV